MMSDPIPVGVKSKPVVVLVDDDEGIRLSLRAVLKRLYTVQMAASAIEGVAIVQNASPSVVVLDIKMPDHDGFWAFREVRRFNKHVPIIFNSAYQETMPQSEAEGAYKPFAYLTKSGDARVFLSIVAEAAALADQLVKSGHLRIR
jgi:CheY-like chemotaxis protein